MSVIKVVSGGQTGVDSCGLEIGRRLGLETGGWATKGFMTEDGPMPRLAEYGLKEMPTSDYPARTRQNVIDSDGTVWFGDETSAGAKVTFRAAEQHDKPVSINPSAFDLKIWIEVHDIKVLNVAGNRRSKLTPEQILRINTVLEDALSTNQ